VGDPGRSSHRKWRPSAGHQLFFAELPKTRLGARFQQTKLRLGERHFGADLLLALLVQIEAGQDFAIALA